MATAYDFYDYPSYWIGREYEHEAEITAIKSLLLKIPKIKTILEIGAGFGRLTPTYAYRAKRVILSDPSVRLVSLAKDTLQGESLEFIQARLENLSAKIRPNSIDLVIIVRVLHHIEKIDEVFSVSRKLLRKNGFIILEFANKRHVKATLAEFLHGNFTFPLDIFPKEIKGPKTKRNSLPFINYHPDVIKEKLNTYGFKILEKRSVSNIRSPFIKKIIPTPTLILLEKYLQKPLAYVNFGPSIFLLAIKTG